MLTLSALRFVEASEADAAPLAANADPDDFDWTPESRDGDKIVHVGVAPVPNGIMVALDTLRGGRQISYDQATITVGAAQLLVSSLDRAIERAGRLRDLAELRARRRACEASLASVTGRPSLRDVARSWRAMIAGIDAEIVAIEAQAGYAAGDLR